LRTPIKAAVLQKPGEPLEITDAHLDDPLDHEVLVRTERVGLCHSDLHYLNGSLAIDLPAVLGHEVSGTVQRVGRSVTRLSPGDRVVATVTPSCGSCAACISGRPTQCRRVDALRQRVRPKLIDAAGEELQLLGGLGAFAEAFVTGESSLALVPDDLPPAAACLLGCCISTGVGAVVHGARVGPLDTVAVIGCGGVGIAAIQGARLAGARKIVAVDTIAEKLGLALRFGATHTVHAGPDPVVTRMRVERIVPEGVTHAIEAVGRPATAQLAFDVLARGGTATILGLMPAGERMTIGADELVYGDRILRGAYMGANRFLTDVDMFVDHYKNGRLDLNSMVTAELPFERINEGFEMMSDPGTVRVVIDPTGGRL
jgi:alcohol dehydrogenase/S-(hydroxymethyl)glutathione dehydrogenase/alcohol dehydrogenase